MSTSGHDYQQNPKERNQHINYINYTVVVGFRATATARTKTSHASTDASIHLSNGICVSVSENSTKMSGHRDWNSSWKTTSGLS